MLVTEIKLNYNNMCFSNFIGAISSIPIFLIMFLPIYIVIGENFPITILIMFISIVIAEIIAYTRNSIGMYINDAKSFAMTPTVFALTLIVIVFSLSLEALTKRLLARLKK